MTSNLTKRAMTPEQRRAVIERIYRAWFATTDLRLGQLLVVACENRKPPLPVYAIGDEALVAFVEELSPPVPHDLTPSEVALAKVLDALIQWTPPAAESQTWADEALFSLWDATPDDLDVDDNEQVTLTGAIADLMARARKAGVL